MGHGKPNWISNWEANYSREGKDSLDWFFRWFNRTRIYETVLKSTPRFSAFIVVGGIVGTYYYNRAFDKYWLKVNKGRLYQDLPNFGLVSGGIDSTSDSQSDQHRHVVRQLVLRHSRKVETVSSVGARTYSALRTLLFETKRGERSNMQKRILAAVNGAIRSECSDGPARDSDGPARDSHESSDSGYVSLESILAPLVKNRAAVAEVHWADHCRAVFDHLSSNPDNVSTALDVVSGLDADSSKVSASEADVWYRLRDRFVDECDATAARVASELEKVRSKSKQGRPPLDSSSVDFPSAVDFPSEKVFNEVGSAVGPKLTVLCNKAEWCANSLNHIQRRSYVCEAHNLPFSEQILITVSRDIQAAGSRLLDAIRAKTALVDQGLESAGYDKLRSLIRSERYDSSATGLRNGSQSKDALSFRSEPSEHSHDLPAASSGDESDVLEVQFRSSNSTKDVIGLPETIGGLSGVRSEEHGNAINQLGSAPTKSSLLALMQSLIDSDQDELDEEGKCAESSKGSEPSKEKDAMESLSSSQPLSSTSTSPDTSLHIDHSGSFDQECLRDFPWVQTELNLALVKHARRIAHIIRCICEPLRHELDSIREAYALELSSTIIFSIQRLLSSKGKKVEPQQNLLRGKLLQLAESPPDLVNTWNSRNVQDATKWKFVADMIRSSQSYDSRILLGAISKGLQAFQASRLITSAGS